MAFTAQELSAKVKAFVILISILICTACSPITSVQSTYDPAVNFSVYQSFAWYPTEAATPSGENNVFNALLDHRLKEAIASELVKNGITPIEVNPGLLVAYDVAVVEPPEAANVSILTPGFGYGYSYWYGYRYTYSGTGIQGFRSIGKYKVGTLVIDLIDKNTNNVVWRGSFDAELDPVTVDIGKINRAVAKIMSQFPPVPRTNW